MLAIFLDIEANGLDYSTHRSIEIALKIIDLSSQKELGSYDSIVSQSADTWAKSDPNSLKVNGFTYEMLESGKSEEEIKNEIIKLFQSLKIHRKNAIYICQNPSFDRAFFSQIVPPYTQEEHLWPYHWLDLASMFWAFAFKKHCESNGPHPFEIGLSKNKIAKFLKIDEEKEPHRAMQGVDHLIDCYFALNTCDKSNSCN